MEERKTRFGKNSTGSAEYGISDSSFSPEVLLQDVRKSHLHTDPATKALKVKASNEQRWAVPKPVHCFLHGSEPWPARSRHRCRCCRHGLRVPFCTGAKSVRPTEPRAAGTCPRPLRLPTLPRTPCRASPRMLEKGHHPEMQRDGPCSL